jgi:anti-sigma factor RsiW
MMTCEQARPLLSAYTDRELDLVSSLDLEHHMQACAGCAALRRQHEDVRAAAAAAPLLFTPPKGLERRVRTAVRREAGRSAWFAAPGWRWAAVPVAATLAALLSWTVAVQRPGSSETPLLAELVSGHVRSLMVDHLVDVASSDQHTVKPWFNGKVDFAPPVTDFTAEGFPLVGGRVDYIAGRPVAVLIYRRRQHTINVFIWPSAKDDAEQPRPAAFEGYHLLRWSASGLTFWAVSDVNSADLESLAQLFQGGA